MPGGVSKNFSGQRRRKWAILILYNSNLKKNYESIFNAINIEWLIFRFGFIGLRQYDRSVQTAELTQRKVVHEWVVRMTKFSIAN